MELSYDIVIIGGGNAGMCAALAARETGATVLVLERAPFGEHGGNSTYTAGAMRFAYNGIEDILSLVPELSEELIKNTEFGKYTENNFFEDLARLTDNRTDPDLADILVSKSFETLMWMRENGVRFLPIYGRQAFKVDGKFTFWGGLTLETWGGGPGLVESLTKQVVAKGIDIAYRARAMELIMDESIVCGVLVKHEGKTVQVKAKAVVLAAGGFEANSEWRAKYLGKGYELAKVRGSKFNTGDGIRMALDAGAMPWGNWSGAHAVGWDLNAPPFGDLEVGDGFQKHSYPFGIMVNAHGERFVDEGADFRNYTYAKYGHVIMDQPNHFAWQIFDQKVIHLLRDEYRIKEVSKVSGKTIEELAKKLDGVDPNRFISTINSYNASIRTDIPFNPNVIDGRRADHLPVPKSNWANTIDEGPFEAYAVTCGITFTFGGLRITTQAEVIDTEEETMPGLYACGELVGGIFYGNYPGGSGLTNGSVFGRIAGSQAGEYSRGK
jgi:tricarballylate dehydrogenase